MEERQEAAIDGRRSQNSERVRAHLYEREFPAKPDRRVLDGERRSRAHGADTGGALRRCHGRSAVPPDDSDMHLGRERPPKTRPGTVIGGWQRGSLTPQMPPSLLPTTAPTATRAAKSAARLTVVKLLIAKNIATSPTDAITFLSRLVDQRTAHEQGGTTAPESVFPPPFLRFRDSDGIQRRRILRSDARSSARFPIVCVAAEDDALSDSLM